MTWEGLTAMIDPPREEAREAVEQARRAGIRTIMITGDHALTAQAIARDLRIADEDSEVLTGRDLSQLGKEEFGERVREESIYARVNPAHKMGLIQALRAHDHVIAMTGDGVNDAPALKEADIGVAMGLTGTDVTKEASDMVLADDNYATLVRAVAEGRAIFDNIRKFIRYLLSSNAGEVLTMFVALAAANRLGLEAGGGGIVLPLLAVQILWINLITDGAPALALAVDRPEPGLMKRPPRRRDERVIDRRMWIMIAVVGVVMTAGTLFVLDGYLPGGLVDFGTGGDLKHARTAAFTTLVIFQMFNVFNCRSQTQSLLCVGLFANRWLLGAVVLSMALHAMVVYWPPLQRAFETTPLTALDWVIATAVASSVLIFSELMKRTPLLRMAD